MRNRNWAAFFSGTPTTGTDRASGLAQPGQGPDRVLRESFAALSGLLAATLLGAIALYRSWISPLLGPKCRFHPTCSSYAAEAIVRYGPFLGTVRALGRLARCHPLTDGGYDPVT